MQAVVEWKVMNFDFHFGPVFHKGLHSSESEAKSAKNHRIILTQKKSRSILLLVEEKQ